MKKYLSILIVGLLLLQVFATVAIAETTLQVVVDTIDAEAGLMAGDSVDVEIRIQNNPGVTSLEFSVAYDADVFTPDDAGFEYDDGIGDTVLKKAYFNEKLIDEDIVCGVSQSSRGVLAVSIFNASMNPTAIEGDFKLFSIPMIINDDADAGSSEITIIELYAADIDENDIDDLEGVSGDIFVNAKPHEHTPSNIWMQNDAQHWKTCSGCGEEIADARGNHADNDSDNACDACGYDMTPAQPEHPVCTFDQCVMNADTLKSEADCDNAAEYYYSCTCGAISDSETFTYGDALGHTESDWKDDADEHWMICTECGDEIANSRADHADDDGDNACDTCDYDMTPDQPGHVCVFDQRVMNADTLKSEADCEDAAEYYYSCTCGAISDSETFTYGDALGHTESDWKDDADEHWMICTECREEIEDSRADHEDADDDGECDVCGYELASDDDNDDDDNDDDDDDFDGIRYNPFIDILLLSRGSNRAIEYVYTNGLFEGISRNEFAPHMTMTRGMFVTVLGRLDGINEEVYYGSNFSDVQVGEWYAPGVAWASQNGIVMGYGDGTFGVNDEITVEQAVVILARYAEYLGIDTASEYALTKFSDRNHVSAWAHEQMQWAVEQGVYDGNGKSLVPQKSASRELVATLIYNFATEYME